MSRKKRSRQNCCDEKESPDYQLDNFLTNYECTSETLCYLCKQDGHFGATMTKSLKFLREVYEVDPCETFFEDRNGVDPKGTWASIYPVDLGATQTKPAWVHLVCALFSPLTWLRSFQWHNLKVEVKRSQTLECSVCKKKGATVGCIIRSCKYMIHVPCALSIGWQPTILRKRFTCPCHTERQLEAQAEIDQSPLYAHDISKGLEPLPVTMESRCVLPNRQREFDSDTGDDDRDDQKKLLSGVSFSAELNYKYLTQNVDSDETESNVVNMNNLPYCDCSEQCQSQDVILPTADSLPCQCLERGDAIAKQLHLNPAQVMTECGMRCECSIGKCCRREIGKGLKWNLHIFIVSQGSSKRNQSAKRGFARPFLLLDEEISDSDTHSSLSGDGSVCEDIISYGVQTKDPISAGSFVCEIIGQYQLADSADLRELETQKVYLLSKWIDECRVESSVSTNETNDKEIILDCRTYRNVGAFIRRSESGRARANVIRKIAFIDQINYRYPRLVLYASRDIARGEEILME